MKLNIKQVTQLFFKRKQYNYEKLDEVMEHTLEIKNFTEGKRRLTMEQMELVIGLLDILTNEGESNGEGNNKKNETDSRKTQLQKPSSNGNENSGHTGGQEESKLSDGLADLRSVQEMSDSSDVSDIQPEGETDSERGLYDN